MLLVDELTAAAAPLTNRAIRSSYRALPGDDLAESRRVLGAVGSKHPDLLWAPASTTKLMTALLTIEAVNAGQVSLDHQVHVQRT